MPSFQRMVRHQAFASRERDRKSALCSASTCCSCSAWCSTCCSCSAWCSTCCSCSAWCSACFSCHNRRCLAFKGSISHASSQKYLSQGSGLPIEFQGLRPAKWMSHGSSYNFKTDSISLEIGPCLAWLISTGMQFHLGSRNSTFSSSATFKASWSLNTRGGSFCIRKRSMRSSAPDAAYWARSITSSPELK